MILCRVSCKGKLSSSITLGHAWLKREWSSTASLPQYFPYPTLKDDSGQLLSRVSGRTTPPLSNETLGQFWNERVEKFRDSLALVVRHEPADIHSKGSSHEATSNECIRWSFGDMDQHIKSLVRGLRKIGVQKGDRVAVLMMNNSSMASLQIATALVGCIFVTLNPSYTANELLRSLNHVSASYLFIVPSLRSSDYIANLYTILPTLASSTSAPCHGDKGILEDPSCPSLKRIILVDNLSRRLGGWGSQNILVQEGKGFEHAKERLKGKAIDYRDILLPKDQPADNFNSEEVSQLGIHDIINLQLTSGTTGAPKAVSLSSHNLVNNALSLSHLISLTSEDKLTNAPPLFHCFGLVIGNLTTWSVGACIVYPSEGFQPLPTLRATSQERCTIINGVPAHFVEQLEVLRQIRKAQKDKGKTKLKEYLKSIGGWEEEKEKEKEEEDWKFTLRTGYMSGSTIPVELMHALMDEMGPKEQTVVYGMTETSPVSFGVDRKAPVKRRCETVGQVMPHCHAKIVHPDDVAGKPIPVGTVGELWTGGYIVMKGYWQDGEKTREVMQVHEGDKGLVWMRTGDLGVMDEEGYVEIRGRVKDLIIRGGENLHPPVIENCIDELEGVVASAAIAVPDDKLGEVVGCFLVRQSGSTPDLTPAYVRRRVKEKISGQSAPDWVWFMGDEGVRDRMPVTASGKVQKVILRQWAKELVAKGIGRAKSSEKES